ncbi:MAG: Na+/H+ antiporter subunit E [Candidatus Omnitrophica bacterium]|nr:Na+/H+ antiporter subunit E [Candidatus Omnitrophota bacterium]
MKSRTILLILGFVVWLLLTGSLDWQHLITGLIVSGFVAYLTGELFTQRPNLFFHPQRYFWFLYYIPVFLWECFKSNIDVALRVIHPNKPLNPGIIRVKTTLRSDTALTFLANSITLTPGTLTVDIDKENGYLYIHWIDIKTTDVDKATEMIVKRFERILKKIFE